MPEPCSPLTDHYVPGCQPPDNRDPSVQLGEITGDDRIQIACWRGRDGDLRALLANTLGVEPPGAGQFSSADGIEVLAVAPDRYWCLGARGDARLATLATAISDDVGCVTQLGHSHVRVRIQGAAARRVLAQEVAIDLEPSAFPTGSAARTVLHHVPVTLQCIAADSATFDLHVPCTFAVSTWTYLLELARPFGYEVLAAFSHGPARP